MKNQSTAISDSLFDLSNLLNEEVQESVIFADLNALATGSLESQADEVENLNEEVELSRNNLAPPYNPTVFGLGNIDSHGNLESATAHFGEDVNISPAEFQYLDDITGENENGPRKYEKSSEEDEDYEDVKAFNAEDFYEISDSEAITDDEETQALDAVDRDEDTVDV